MEENKEQKEIKMDDLDKEKLIKLVLKQKERLEEKEETVKELKNELEEKEEKVSEVEELAKKIKADYENYKKRVDKKLNNREKETKKEVFKEILDVVDSFDKALEASEDIDKDFLEGVKNIRQLLLDKLKNQGLKEVNYDCFNPSMHQAIAKVDVDGEKDSDEIIEVVQRGYLLDEEVIRPALVKVQK